MADEPKIKKQRRDPLVKEHFLEGNRQKWCAVYTAIGLLIMAATSYGLIKDPSPFMGYFTGIGVTFILGASATAVMGAYKMNSTTNNENIDEKKEEDINETESHVETVNIHEDKLLKMTRLDSKDIDDEAFEEESSEEAMDQ